MDKGESSCVAASGTNMASSFLSGLGSLSVLPGEILTRNIFSLLTQEEQADLCETSRAMRTIVRPLLSRAIRCSFCESYLLHPRGITRKYPTHPTLFIVRDSLPPTVIAANSRFYCAECRSNIGKLVAVRHDAHPVIALEKGPARLVNGDNVVVASDGIKSIDHPFFCAECRNRIGSENHDLLYSTKRRGVEYVCCYTLRDVTSDGHSEVITDEQWGVVRTESVSCSFCGFVLGYRYLGRITGPTRNGALVNGDGTHEASQSPSANAGGVGGIDETEDNEQALLDDLGNIRYTMLMRERIVQTKIVYCRAMQPA